MDRHATDTHRLAGNSLPVFSGPVSPFVFYGHSGCGLNTILRVYLDGVRVSTSWWCLECVETHNPIGVLQRVLPDATVSVQAA